MCNKSTGWGGGERGERVGGWEEHERVERKSEGENKREKKEKRKRGWEEFRNLPMLVMLKIERGI